MKGLEVSVAVRLIYKSLGVKELNFWLLTHRIPHPLRSEAASTVDEPVVRFPKSVTTNQDCVCAATIFLMQCSHALFLSCLFNVALLSPCSVLEALSLDLITSDVCTVFQSSKSDHVCRKRLYYCSSIVSHYLALPGGYTGSTLVRTCTALAYTLISLEREKSNNECCRIRSYILSKVIRFIVLRN